MSVVRSYPRRRLSRDEYAARFWARVAVAGPDECWLWTGAMGRDGYGLAYSLQLGPKTMSVHRIAYILKVGPIPAGLLLRHSCDVALCCNPAHLLTGVLADNARDMAERGRAHGGRIAGTPTTKISDELVGVVVAERAAGASIRELAAKYGVTAPGIRYVINKRAKRA